MGEYKLINLRQDYYNGITAEELEGLYSLKNDMRKRAWNSIAIHTALCLSVIAVSGFIAFLYFDKFGTEALLSEGFSDCIGFIIVYFIILAEAIANAIKELGRWSDFYFGKGKIISLESEFFEGNKRRPEGYYRHTLTIAVSETEAVGNIFYFSDEPWESEKYIGKDAAAVYFPKAHLLYAVIDGEDAEKYSEEFYYSLSKKLKA
ncbi:hypothetical protein [Huintestinicola sp.]|uniref:hypothetical protein n=1 Tax=Huintestinicola sp. TaxID=2981661 RepID=UPI003D7C9890